ncbi:MAG TPA: MFS transporter, partial [Bacillota bacterium]
NPPQVTGIVAGIVNSGAFIGAGLMQPLFGWVLDRHWQGAMVQGVRVYPLHAYQSAFWFCAVVLGLGIGFSLLVKETKCVNITLAKNDG